MPDLIPVVYEQLDERFGAVRGDDYLERLWKGGRWTEGPAYVPSGKYLLWSDIPNDRILRWDETDGSTSVYATGVGYTNGRTLDRRGRVVTCEQGARRVTRVEHDGSVTVLADSWNGKRLNSPNDVVVSSDEAIWFTDPPYGITTDYEGERAEQEIDGCHVYRIDPVSGAVEAVATDFVRPNGLAFSADESLLYIADTPRRHVRVFGVDGAGLTGGEVFADITVGNPDGIRVDTGGRVWVAAGDGLHVHDPDGTLLGKIAIPEVAVSNLEFGGPKRNRLFITASAAVYSLMVTVNGVARI
ncbi:SMP-30/gluconolactonase/LRE family protein [Phytomonospora endophytica]|uniref:Gluconolactonase n=1 Tax=Phytomonospora endophytica TaxID=714109 RepID=A0A841FSY9_9ACTN|nr:SMP-30/gluconolactonase/LRE family protein [Phytomonospora endophytica]MBB6039405.1 gluconolactonase [Phytomonospora endophytica]GIG70132.1 gluconolactonase [Phytomonospora endophytica]